MIKKNSLRHFTQEISKVLLIIQIMAHTGDTPSYPRQPLPPGHDSYLFDPFRPSASSAVTIPSLIDVSTPSGEHGSNLSPAAAPFQPRGMAPSINPRLSLSQLGASPAVTQPRSHNPFETAHESFSNAPNGPRMPAPKKDPKSVSFWTDQNDHDSFDIPSRRMLSTHADTDNYPRKMSSTPADPVINPSSITPPTPASEVSEQNPPHESDVESASNPYQLLINARCDAEKKLDCVALQLRRSLAEGDRAVEGIEMLKIAFAEFEVAHDQINTYLHQVQASREDTDKEDRYYNIEVKNYIDLLNFANEKVSSSRVSSIDHHASMSSLNLSNDIMKIVHSIKAPQVIIDTFDGSDSKKFHPFIKKFDLAMQGCDDFKYMTQMLLQSCKKDAGRDLGGILFISDPKKAYEEGRRILFEKYGDHSEIAYGIVDSLRNHKSCSSANDLKSFASDLNTAYRTLIELKIYDRMMSDTVIREIVLKLPEYLCRQYQKRALKYKRACGFYPDFQFVVDFVQECSDLANDKVFGQNFLDVKSTQNLASDTSASRQKKPSVNAVSNATGAESNDFTLAYSCPVCQNGTKHKLWSCVKFKQMRVPDRIKLVREQKLCHQCLAPGHFADSCYRTTTCKVDGCGRKHTMWIHGIHDSATSFQTGQPRQNSAVHTITRDPPSSNLIDLSANQSSSSDQSESCESSSHACNSDKPTAKVLSTHGTSGSGSQDLKVHMPIVNCIAAGNLVIKVGLDCFSSNTFCSERLIKAAGLSVYTSPGSLTLGTMSGVSSHDDIKCTDFTIQSMNRETTVKLSGVFVWDKIPVKCNYLDTSKFDHLRDLDLVTGEITEVDLLIGQDFSQCLLPLHTFKNEDNLQEPFAILTILGTCLNGRSRSLLNQVSSTAMNTHVSVLNTSCIGNSKVPSLDKIEHDISRLYDIESPAKIDSWSQNELRVIHLWEDNHIRIGNKYQIPIPLKEPDEPVPNNYAVVKAMNDSLVKRLKRDGTYEAYDKKMRSLIDDKYVEIIPPDPYNNPGKTLYIPHHKVDHPRKTEPRIVHNAKFKHKGLSLNDRCLQGPNFLSRADSVLTRFRFHEFAFIGDIKAMYFQVIIPPEQRDLLRFLWFDEDGNLIHLRHCRHIFGGVWCSSSSQFVLRKAIENEANSVIRNAVLDGFYVDDCLTSVDKKADLLTLVNELPETLDLHGYEITKMLVNDTDVLSVIPRERRAAEVKDLTPTDEIHTYALGIRWEVNSDTFYFVFDEYVNNVLTRRIILSIVSSVYDPLGMISPLIIYGRILFQESNRLKLNWDEPLPESLIQKWDDWIESLQNISNMSIPRCVKLFPIENCTLELHTFADASMEAYCAVSYVRAEDLMSENITCNMIRSKTRVAPIKQLSIPRLELQACLMACQLSSMVRDDLGVNFESYFWTDSKIALAYIMNDDKKFAPFVANRLTDINLLSAKKDWRYVSTHDNPADLGTRGKVLTHEELTNSIWFTGPEWLVKDKSEWPAYTMTHELDDEAEMRKVVINVASCNTTHPVPVLLQNVFEHYSSFYAMKRAVGILSRWVRYVTGRPTYPMVPFVLNGSELVQAELVLITLCQSHAFRDEIEQLKRKEEVNLSSPISNLHPFLDKNDVLRVGGRTGSHPVILPNKHPLARAVVLDAHTMAHLGVEWTLGIVRNKFWIVKARPLVKSIIYNCVTCKKIRGKPMEQIMSPLPSERITPGMPVFTYVGVDVYGPYLIKNYRSEVKRYGSLFTCMTTRAVHIEVLNSLDTSSMINAVSRFKSRRGSPIKYFSDNATNLIAADKELRISFKVFSQEELTRYAAKGNADWEFIPPKAPHFGGAWERLIGVSKQVARGLRAACADTKLNDEILATLFAEVECIVNSRPLTKMNDDPNDFTPITPNHLLLMKDGLNMPPGLFDTDDVYRRIWRHTQYLVNRFWKCWVRLYLPNLQSRCKWRLTRSNVAKGDLVLLMEQNVPRNLWPLAIVDDVSIGRDGLVRSVVVRTRTTTFRRPITQIIMLEAKANEKV